MEIIQEQKAKIRITLPQREVHRKLPVFYNPVMKSNRNISILLLNSLSQQGMKMAFPLAGSGVRAIRFWQELKKSKIKELVVNDLKPNFRSYFRENLSLNEIKAEQIKVFNQDASLFLLQQEGFDYIDLDPFGSPNDFLYAAVKRLSRQGILAVTATDTAALTGTYPKVTLRKYWSTSVKTHLMHETGLRILIRKIQLQGLQFDKALIPLLSYHKDHYFRVYFLCIRGKEQCDHLLQQHQYLLYSPSTTEFKPSLFNQEEGFQALGPLWVGKLFDPKLLKKMVKNNPFPEEQKFLELLSQEKDLLGFYDIHVLAKKFKFNPGKISELIKNVNGSRTHFSPYGLKTEKKLLEIINIINQQNKKNKS